MNASTQRLSPYIGKRVEIHPRFDLWMRGARFGEIVAIRCGKLRVRLDKVPSRTYAFAEDDVTLI